MEPLVTASDLFVHRLEEMVAMERDAALLADACAQAVHRDAAAELLHRRSRAARQHTRTVEEVFELAGLKMGAADCATTRVLVDHAAVLLDAGSDVVHDDIALALALGMESLISAAYDALTITARELGATDLRVRLEDTLADTQRTATALRDMLEAVIRERRPVA